MTTAPSHDDPGRDMQPFRKPKIIRCAEHRIACAHAVDDGVPVVMQLFGDLKLALGRDELGITRSRWCSSLPRARAIDEARGFRN